MFPELENFLCLDRTKWSLLCVSEEPPADGSLVLCHLINRALNSNTTVYVLALNKPPSHYRHLCAKCGGGVRLAENAGTLTFLDGAEMAVDSLWGKEGSLRLTRPFTHMQELFEQLMAQSIFSEPGLLVIDGVSALVDLGATASEVLLLVQNLAVWARASGGSVAALTTVDNGGELALLAAAVRRLADIAVHVRGLPSGHCAEVTGQLEVRRAGHPVQVQQFKSEDRNVRVFAPGTSRAVL